MARKPIIPTDYSDTYIECRSMGHAWKRMGILKAKNNSQYVRLLQCLRCKAKRRDLIDRDGFVESRNYTYPPKYHTGKVKRMQFTKEQITRVKVTVVPSLNDIDF